VPQNISIGLHSALNEFIKKIYSAGPHSLPGHVQADLSQKTASSVVEVSSFSIILTKKYVKDYLNLGLFEL